MTNQIGDGPEKFPAAENSCCGIFELYFVLFRYRNNKKASTSGEDTSSKHLSEKLWPA